MKYLKKIMLITIVSISSVNAYYASICDKAEGYYFKESLKGITLCGNGDDDYIQIIDLNEGAKLEFIYNEKSQKTITNKDGSTYEMDVFKLETIDTMWNKFKNHNIKATSIVNGTFFEKDGAYEVGKNLQIAYFVKNNNNIITNGYHASRDKSIQEEPNLLFLRINNNIAKIDLENYTNDYYVLGGLSCNADKENDSKSEARTMIGVNENKIYILSSNRGVAKQVNLKWL